MNMMYIYNEKMNDVGASSGHWTRVFRWRGETCNRSTTAAPYQVLELILIYLEDLGYDLMLSLKSEDIIEAAENASSLGW